MKLGDLINTYNGDNYDKVSISKIQMYCRIDDLQLTEEQENMEVKNWFVEGWENTSCDMVYRLSINLQ